MNLKLLPPKIRRNISMIIIPKKGKITHQSKCVPKLSLYFVLNGENMFDGGRIH